jgi:DNA polymerase III alpha subunit
LSTLSHNLKDENASGKVCELSEKGLQKKYKIITPDISSRLAYELSVINSLKASCYFLLLNDIIKYLNRLAIPHYCFGNANASLVCYCLGLTSIDPIKHGLAFESFIIPGQQKLPDFNLDLEDARKMEATKALIYKFGIKKLGLIPLVIAGQKQITDLHETLRKIKQKVNLWEIPLNDKKTWAYLQCPHIKIGDVLVSKLIDPMLQKYAPSSFEDLLAISSLKYLKNKNGIDQYFSLKNNHGKISYLHPVLQPALEKTLGMILHQEQILQIAQLIGGCNLEEADGLRTSLEEKGNRSNENNEIVFIKNARNKGIGKKDARNIFSFMQDVAPVLLFKAEAVADAYMVYQKVYLKANYQ